MLIIDRSCLDEVLDHGRRGYPHEVCGLLLGTWSEIDGGPRRHAREVVRCDNLERQRAGDRYDIDPRDLMQAEELAERQELSIVGSYHSHPDAPPSASKTDRERAVDVWQDLTSWSYLIVEVAKGQPSSYRSWLLRDRQFEAEPIAVQPRRDLGDKKMAATVRIPTPLRPMTQGRNEVSVTGANVREVLDSLEQEAQGIRKRICDDAGELRRFVNVFLNDEDVRHLQGLDSQVKDGDVLSIVPAIAGG